MWLSRARAEELILWLNPLESGIAFGSVLVLLLAVRYVSLLSAVGNLTLALLTATMAFRIYRSVLAAVNKTDDGHPFRAHLEMDITLPSEEVADLMFYLLGHVNRGLEHLKTVFLFLDVIETLKFAGGMYTMTIFGRYFNGLTLIIVGWMLLFSIPRVYKDNQPVIDEALAPMKVKLDELSVKIRSSLPGYVPPEAKKDL